MQNRRKVCPELNLVDRRYVWMPVTAMMAEFQHSDTGKMM